MYTSKVFGFPHLTRSVISLLLTVCGAFMSHPGLAQTSWGACGVQDFTHVNAQPATPLVPGSLRDTLPRPGPDILYAPLATSPQLENTGPWNAQPILISGASAYRLGEFLYQDFLYDDGGAGGRYTYPTNVSQFAGNAADFVELRIKPLSGGTAVRITYNSLINPESTAATIALGNSTQALSLPHNANTRAPAQVFVTVHGSSADVVDAASGQVLPSPGLASYVDLPRRQVHVCIPYSVFDPRGNSQVRIAAATGLWDVNNGAYLVPGTTATATQPGGARVTNPTAFFNVAFRYTEALTNFANSAQSTALTSGDISTFAANVDFTALASGVNNDLPGVVGGVPQSGRMNRILVSHFEPAQGRGSAASLQPSMCPQTGCLPPTFAGRLQTYEIYVPVAKPNANGYGLFLSLHYLSGNMNTEPLRWQQEAGEQAVPFISITPNARGAIYWYYGIAGADVFEAWADVAHHYKLNPDLASIGGTSMGAFGTWKLSGQFPDLFGSAQSQVPCPSAGTGWVQGKAPPGGVSSLMILTAPSTRWLPQYNWFGTLDTTCSYWAQSDYENLLDTMGYRYNKISFVHGHVGSPMIGDEYQPLVDFMNNKTVVRDPPHITFVMNGEENQPEVGLNSDHAYWVSGLTLRDAMVSPPIGKIDLMSFAFGVADPAPNPTQTGSGVYVGTTGPVSYTFQSRDWGATPQIPASNSLKIVAQNIRTLTINVQRARVDCSAALRVLTDGPVDITLDGCGPGGVHHFSN
jgi:hypothetical protein